ncbi:MAG: ArnT family glycosyltransferase, partial [Anaerolineae bacterium]
MMTDRDPAELNRDRPLSWLLWAAALGAALYLVGLTLWLAFSGLFFPYQLDYGEGALLHFVREWAQGQPIYKAIDSYPYVVANYPPSGILLALLLTPILGLSYAAGRIWTLLALVAVTALIVAWVRRTSRRWLPALAAGLLFAGSPYIYHWAPLFRVDLIGLALTLGGLYAVKAGFSPGAAEVGPGRKAVWRRPIFWVAVVLFVAALYAKQSFVFAPAAALIYLFFFVDRRQALAMAAGIALLGGGVFAAVTLLTAGGFWSGLVTSNVNPFLWAEFWKQQTEFFTTFSVLVLLAGWYLVDKFLLGRTGAARPGVTPLDVYLPAALLSLGLAGRAGAWENYFFEALAALAVAAGLGLARLAGHGSRLLRLAAPALVLAQVALMWHTPRDAMQYLDLTRRSNEAMEPILATTPDPIASEDLGLLVTNDKVSDYFSFQYSQLARAGRWDQSWELDRLRQRTYAMVVLERGTRLDVDRYQRFTREFLSELDRNYRHSRTVGKYELYVPNPLQHEQRVTFGDGLSLVGWSLHLPAEGAEVQPGDAMHLEVVWQAEQTLDRDYTAFAHLVGGDGRGWAGDDHQPYQGSYPTSAWGSGEMVRDTFTLTVPSEVPPGLYDVHVGWYDPQTQER